MEGHLCSKERNALYTKAIKRVLIHVVSIVMHWYWFVVACGKVAHWQQCAERRVWCWEALFLSSTGWLLAAPHAVCFQRGFKLGLIHKTGKQQMQRRHIRAEHMRTSSIDFGNVLDWLDLNVQRGIDVVSGESAAPCTGGKDKKTQACVSNTFMHIWMLSYTASWRITKLMGTKPCVSLQQVFTCTKITREFTSPTRRDTNTHKHIHIHILPYSSICQLRYYNRSTSTAY